MLGSKGKKKYEAIVRNVTIEDLAAVGGSSRKRGGRRDRSNSDATSSPSIVYVVELDNGDVWEEVKAERISEREDDF